ncbi:MAG: trypsin-like peptidase domain-containing protein [Myxococcota bacterium]
MNRANAVLLGVLWLLSLVVAVRFARLTEPLPTVAPLVRKVGPSVVSIEAGHRRGSGFAIGATEVVTARHLVDEADIVTVQTSDGQRWPAAVRGSDARTDLALLVVDGSSLAPARLGRGDRLTVGDWVVGLGNALGLGSTPVVGLIAQQGSKLSADAEGPRAEFWQLSLALNPGHSGGPVFDQRGRVVAVLAGTLAQGQSVAFAVPIEAFREVEDRLRAGEHISRAYLGARTIDGGSRGLVVTYVFSSSPADLAALRPGDVLRELDGTELHTPEDLQRVLDRLSGGVRTGIVSRRGSEDRETVVQLTDWALQPVVVAGMTLGPAKGAGARVVALHPDSRAARARLREGDVLRAIDGVPMRAPAMIKDRLADGGAAQLQVVRDGRLRLLRLGGRDSPAPRRAPR